MLIKFVIGMGILLVIIFIIEWFIRSLKSAPTVCNYDENCICDNLDETNFCDCVNCDFYKMLNEKDE